MVTLSFLTVGFQTVANAAAGLIASQGIDVLVDLAGHTAGNRLLAFARKQALAPTPVDVHQLVLALEPL